MKKAGFDWNYIERCNGELDALIARRTAKEFTRAVKCADKDNFKEAEEMLSQYVEVMPNDYLGYFFLGAIFQKQYRNSDRAVNNYIKSQKLKPENNLNGNLQVGLHHYRQESYDEAIKYLIKADLECYTNGLSNEELLSEILKGDNINNEVGTTEIEEEDYSSDFGLFEVFSDSIDVTHKKNHDIECLKLLYAMAHSLISKGENSSAAWYIKRCQKLDPNALIFKACSICVDFSVSTKNKLQDLIKIKPEIRKMEEQKQKNLPKPIREFVHCMQSLPNHKSKCIGYCLLMDAVDRNNNDQFEKAIEKNRLNPYFKLIAAKYLLNAKQPLLKNRGKDILKQTTQNCGQSFSADAFRMLGKIYYSEKNYGEAIYYFDKFIKADQNNPKIQLRLGKAYFRNQQFEQVIYTLLPTLKLKLSDEQKQSICYYSALSYEKMGKFKEGIEVLDLIKPITRKKATYLAGMLNYKVNNFKTSLQKFQQCLGDKKIKNNNSNYWIGCILRFKNEDMKIVLSYFEKETQLNPQFKPVYFQIGLYKFEQEKFFDSIPNLQKAIYPEMEDDQPYRILSIIFMKLRQFDKLILNYREWRDQFSAVREETALEFAKILQFHSLDASDASLAIEMYTIDLTLNPDNLTSQYSVAKCYLRLGKDIEALSMFTQVVEKDPSMFECYFQIGQIHVNRGDYELARPILEKGFSFNPDHPIGLLNLAIIALLKDKQAKVAIRLLKKSLLKNDKNASTYLYLGLAYRKLKTKLKKAQIQLELANVLMPKNDYINLILGFVLFDSGNVKQAYEKLKILKMPPVKAGKYFYCLAIRNKKERQFRDSKQQFEQCLTFGLNRKLNYFKKTVQFLLDSSTSSKDFDYFINIMIQIAKLNGVEDHPLINKYLGMAYVSRPNSFRKAKLCLQKSIVGEPESEICKIRLAKCEFELEEIDLKEIEKNVLGFNCEQLKKMELLEYEILLVEIYLKSNKNDLALSVVEKWNFQNYPVRIFKQARHNQAMTTLSSGNEKAGKKQMMSSSNSYAPSVHWVGLQNQNQGLDPLKYFLDANAFDSDYTPAIKSIADLYQNLKKFKEAQDFYEQYIEKSELFSVEVRISFSRCLIAQQEYKKPQLFMKEILDQYAYHTEATLIMGQSLTLSGDFKAGKDILEAGIVLSPDNHEMKYYLSICEQSFWNNTRAIDLLLDCVSIQESALYWSSLGVAYQIQEEWDLAKEKFEKCLLLEPFNHIALLKLAVQYSTREKNLDLALKYIERYIKNNSIDQDSIFILLTVQHYHSKSKEILENFKRYSDFLNNNVAVELRILDHFFDNINKIPGTTKMLYKQLYDIEIKKDEKSKVASKCLIRLAQIAFIQKEYVESNNTNISLSKLYKLQEREKDKKTRFNFLRAQIEMQKENFNISLRYLQKCIRQKKNPKIQIAAKLLLLWQLLYTKSNKGFKLYSELENQRSEIINSDIEELFLIVSGMHKIQQANNVVNSYKKNDLLLEGQQYFKECLSKFGKSELAFYYLSICLIEQNKDSEAKYVFIDCFACEKQESNSIYSKPLTKIELLKSKYDYAVKNDQSQLQILIEDLLAVDHLESVINYTELLFKKGDRIETIHQAKRALKLNRTNARMYFIIASLSTYEQALYYFKKCYLYQPDYPDIDNLLANAFEQCGQFEDAFKIYISKFSYYDKSTKTIEKCIQLLTSIQSFKQAQILINRYKQVHSILPASLCLSQAHLMKRQGMHQQAIAFLKSSIQSFPRNAEIVISLGCWLNEEKRYSEVVEILTEFLATDICNLSGATQEQKAQIHNMLGNSFAFIGDFEKSLQSYKNSYECSADIQVKINLGVCQLASKKLDKAKQTFSELIELNKNEIMPHFYLGVTHQLMKSDQLAIKQYKRCVANYPLFAPAAINLSIVYRRQGNFKEAIQVLFPFNESDIKLINPIYHLALCYYESNQPLLASSLLKQILANYEIYEKAGNINSLQPIHKIYEHYIHINLGKDYAKSYQESKASIPSRDMISLLLSRVNRKQNRIDLELGHLKQCLTEDESNPEFIFTHAISQFIANKKYSGKEDFLKCIAINPERKSLYLLAISNELHKKGSIKEEIQILKEAIELNPVFGQAYTNLGVAYMKIREYANAMIAFEQAIMYGRNNPDSHFNLANVLILLRQTDLAIQSYKKVLELSPNHIQALYNLGVAYQIVKDLKQSSSCYEKCLELDGINAEKYQPKINKLHKQLIQA